MSGLAPRAPGDSVRPRRSSDVVVRPLNFTVGSQCGARSQFLGLVPTGRALSLDFTRRRLATF